MRVVVKCGMASKFNIFTNSDDTFVQRLVLFTCARTGTPLIQISTHAGPCVGAKVTPWEWVSTCVCVALKFNKADMPPIIAGGGCKWHSNTCASN